MAVRLQHRISWKLMICQWRYMQISYTECYSVGSRTTQNCVQKFINVITWNVTFSAPNFMKILQTIQTLTIGKGVSDRLRRRVERTEGRGLHKMRPLLLREEYSRYALSTLAILATAVLNIERRSNHLPSIFALPFVCDTLVMNALHCRKPVASEPYATYGWMILFSLPTVRKYVV